MNLDKFSKRSRPAEETPPAGEAFDFTQIARDAVSDMRAQQGADEFDFDGQADSPSPRGRRAGRRAAGDDGAPARERKSFAFGKRQPPVEESGPWDMPAGREEAPARERKPFSFGKRQKAEEAADSWDQPAGREEAPARERKPFAFGKRQKTDEFADSWDQPAGREEAPARERKPFAFGKRQKTDDAENASSPRRASAFSDDFLPDNDSFDDFDDFGDIDFPAAASVPSSPAPQPAAEPERRVFNAATQPNYAYMTDYPEEPVSPALTDQPEGEKGGIFGSLRAGIDKMLNRDDPDVEYYTPPANRAPSDIRRRQKRRNRKPVPQWLKMAIFAVGLLTAFLAILYLSFFLLITGRINYVGDSNRNPVYLSVAEYANLGSDLTDTEENAAEFTEPLNIAEPNEDIKVIMVVSSDGRIGDVYDRSGRKITNESAKTDSIMLIALDHANRRIRVASIMTDTYVRIQDYKTNKLSKAYYYDTANGDYTLPTLRQAVRDNFGVTPDNYLVMDFNAFQILINRLGGVEIEVSADEAYYMSAHETYGDFPRFNSAGRYKMSGTEALNYVRMRAVGNDDYDRSARQRYMLRQILAKTQEMSAMELAELAYAILPELPTDMTAGQLFGYLSNASDIASYEVNEVTFPITNSWRYGTATVRDIAEPEPEEIPVSESDAVSSGDVTSGSDAVSGSDIPAVTPPDPRSTKFTVIVANFQFNATVLQKFLYENDDSYLNGTAASGISVPEIIAPLEIDSPAAGLAPASAG